MAIALNTWLAARSDYITGGGSLAVIAERHGLNPSSVERRARNEHWTRLRSEYDAGQLARLLPPQPPTLTVFRKVMSHLRNLLWLADSDGRWLGHKDGGALAMKVYGHLRDHHSVAMAQKVSFSHQTPAEHPPKEQTPSATPAPPKA